jgi:hypothetical protein
MIKEETTNPYEMFETDAEIEKAGITIDYGDYYWVIARAGGANKAYGRRLEALMRPYRRAIQTETLPDAKAKELMQQAFIETVVISWGSKKHGKGIMVGRDNAPLEFTKENIAQVIKDLDWLWRDLDESSRRAALFRKVVEEVDEKNS